MAKKNGVPVACGLPHCQSLWGIKNATSAKTLGVSGSYFVGISPYIGLIYGRYLRPQSVPVAWPLTKTYGCSASGDSLPMEAMYGQWEISRILNWRYVSTIFLAIFSRDIP